MRPKKKNLKSMETYTTVQLLEVIQQGFLSQPQGQALEELLFRVIKENDTDDTPKHRGGIRPLHAPIV